jgi:hypothetical protein
LSPPPSSMSSISRARIVYGRRRTSAADSIATPSPNMGMKKRILNDEEFATSLCALSHPSPSSDTSMNDRKLDSDQEDVTVLNLNNCKRKHEMMELGSNSRFRDELDFMMQGLESDDMNAILDAMQEIKQRIQSDDDFGSRMRAMRGAQGMFDLLRRQFDRHGDIVREGIHLFLTISKNVRRLDFVMERQSWFELLELSPGHAELAKRMVASGMDIHRLRNKDVLLNALVESREWDMLDTCWQDDPDKWIGVIHDMGGVIASMHLPCLVTLSGTREGPGLIHKHSPSMFHDLLMNDDVASQSILINLVDRPECCPHRHSYASIPKDLFDVLVTRNGLGAVLAMLLHTINPESCVISDMDKVRAHVNTFIEMLRKTGRSSLAEEIQKLTCP